MENDGAFDSPTMSNMRNILKLFRYNDEKRLSDGEEIELMMKIYERLPSNIFYETRLKHYILRYREAKRPSIHFFETLFETLEAKVLKFKMDFFCIIYF